ncbi:MAG TPA: nucleoside hydrolase [Armatimonadota bacterium]|nr:nucleoside hydrolase [Armatimonadota bacterium]
MKRVVIDTDAGVDDALALILALRSPELRVEAITTVSGNVHVDLCTENVLRVLDVLELEEPPPVAKGAADPLVKPLFTAPEVHGADGLGGLHALMEETGALKYARPTASPSSMPAFELLADLADRHAGDISLITIGPLTNVAKAILEHPKRMAGFKEIICMGGAFRVYGNTTPVAEFNIFVDPHAAQVVLDSGIPMTFVPLDVTERVCLEMGHIVKEIQPVGTRLSRFVSDLTRGYVRYHMHTEGFPGCYLHDPLAVGVCIDPTFCGVQEGFVQIETAAGITMGMTVCDLRPNPLTPEPPNARICTEVDAGRFFQFFLDRIRG